MTKRIAIIQGHPDAQNRHYGHALAKAYFQSATEAGHELRVIEIARLDFPLLRNKDEFDHGTPPDVIRQAQETIRWAEHLVIFYPLWLGSMPALLKAPAQPGQPRNEQDATDLDADWQTIAPKLTWSDRC